MNQPTTPSPASAGVVDARAGSPERLSSDPVWDALAEAPVPAAVVDARGRVVRANEAIARLVAARIPEDLGRSWQEFTATPDLPAAREMWDRVMSGDVPSYRVRRQWVRTDGWLISVELQVSRRAAPDGSPELLVLAVDRTPTDAAERIAQERFREAFENAPIGMSLLDMDRRFVELNEAQAVLAGTSRENLIGRCVDEFIDTDDLPASYADMSRLEGGSPSYRTLRHGWRANGDEAWMLVSTTLLRNHGGEPVNLFVQLVDVTAEVTAQQEVARRLTQLGMLSELGQMALTDTPVEQLDDAVSAAVVEVLPAYACGVLEHRGDGLHVARWRGPDRLPFTTRHLRPGGPLDEAARRPGVQVVPLRDPEGGCEGTAVVVGRDDSRVIIVACMTARDATRDSDEFLSSCAQILAALRQRQTSTDQLRLMATHEPLTGLANRRLLADQLPAAVARARRNPHPTALLLVDLDDFKLVNDTFGHATGDVVLQQVAGRLRHAVRSFDLVVRMGGDEFLVVAESVDAAELRSLRDRLARLVCAPLDVEGRRLVVHATVADVISHGEEDPEQLLQRADELLYRRKSQRQAESPRRR